MEDRPDINASFACLAEQERRDLLGPRPPGRMPGSPLDLAEDRSSLKVDPTLDRPRMLVVVGLAVHRFADVPHRSLATQRPPREVSFMRITTEDDVASHRQNEASLAAGLSLLTYMYAAHQKPYGFGTLLIVFRICDTIWYGSPSEFGRRSSRYPLYPSLMKLIGIRIDAPRSDRP
jgi:hypothetical protein